MASANVKTDAINIKPLPFPAFDIKKEGGYGKHGYQDIVP